jgi:hypothetical protein
MRLQGRGEKLFDWLWFLLWALASSAWCVTAAARLSATFDEPLYVSLGLEHWRTGSYAGLMRVGTMPLPVDVETWPLSLWERWRGTPFDATADLETLLPWARAGNLLFWWLLLFYARLAGRHLAGPWGGRLAVALLAVEPSLLANAGLATTDIALTATVLALTYHFAVGRTARWPGRVGVPSLCFAAAVLAKASGLMFGPLCLFAVEVERLWRNRVPSSGESRIATFAGLKQAWQRLWPLRRDGVQIVALGLVLVFVYCGSDWQPQKSFIEWAHGLPEGPAHTGLTWLAEHLRIFTNAGEGLIKQVLHNVRGHGVYLLGQTDRRALWYYFPVLLTIKLTVPLLLAPFVLGAVGRRRLVNWACLAAVFLLAFSLTCRVQIGVRLVLPLVVLAVAGLAAGAVQSWRALSAPWGRRVLTTAIVVGLAWNCWDALRVWPDGLCYINSLWGGTEQGYELVSDANYDWGQGLKELADWERREQVEALDVWYFGSDPLVERLPMRRLPLHAFPLAQPGDVLPLVQGRFLAVSTTLLFGHVGDTPAQRHALTFLRQHQPVGRTATFFIYDFTEAGK